MDPLTAAAAGAAITVAVEKFSEGAWGQGKKWLAHYYEGRHPKAKLAAQENALEFLNGLAIRVRQMEEAQRESDASFTAKVESALEDPDVAALLHDAMIASARTASAEKHVLLARVVAERLKAEPEELVALTSAVCCDVIPRLTPRQLRQIAVLAVAHYIRPSFGSDVNEIVRASRQEAFYAAHFTPLLPIEAPLEIDAVHMESLSCLAFESFIVRDLKKVLASNLPDGVDWPHDHFVTEMEAGRQLAAAWKGLQKCRLSTVVRLIGIYVHDTLSGTSTTVNW